MDYSFKPSTFRELFHKAIDRYIADEAQTEDEDSHSPHSLVAAMDQAIDVMARADADSKVKPAMSAESIGTLDEKEITEIGQYALDILEGLVSYVQTKTGEQDRDLLRLSIPISLWVAAHGGRLHQIEMVVNSLASYANEINEPPQLAELAGIIQKVINACSDEIRQDLEQSNPMRPWRILNLNFGIVATRSHNPALIEEAYDCLVKNLPQDAREFFREGMQQMDIIGYPQEVREIVERYDRMWGAESTLH